MIQNYYLKRTAQAVFTVFAVITITFGLVRLIPGGPASYIRAQLAQQAGSVDMQQINTLVEVYTNIRPDAPLHVQYLNYLTSLLQGDLGTSLYYSTPVSEILASAVPWTTFVMATSLVLTFGIGVSLGAVMAYVEGSKFDVTSTLGSIFLNSIPYYVLAILLVYLLGYQLGWFPTGGRLGPDVAVGFTPEFVASAMYHAALPIVSFVATGFGIQALSMRGNSVRVLGEDYIRVARLRGIPPSDIALQYVGRNAILPMYTGMMIAVGFMFGGSVIMEEIFAYPGVGYYLFRAISASDYPLMMGAFLIITVAVVVGIFVADLTYGKLDPRAGHKGGDRESY